MIRKVALAASLSTLTACATPSARPAEPPNTQACDARVAAPVPEPPVLPKGATLVAPADDAERAATAAFVTWVVDLKAWGLALAARAEVARQACAGP